jgi:hypothetical protein
MVATILWRDPSPNPSAPTLTGEVRDDKTYIYQSSRRQLGDVALPPENVALRLPAPLPPWITTDGGVTFKVMRITFSYRGDTGLFWAGWCPTEQRWYVSDMVVWIRHRKEPANPT